MRRGNNITAAKEILKRRKKGKEDKSTGVMIHVGGKYEKGGKTFTVGSFGCFSLCDKDQGNKGAKEFIKDVVKRR